MHRTYDNVILMARILLSRKTHSARATERMRAPAATSIVTDPHLKRVDNLVERADDLV